jgi:phenylacetate-CoA ligase
MRRFNKSERATLALRFLREYQGVKLFNSLSQERVDAFQLERVRRIVGIAYQDTNFYRRKFDAAGVTPQDVRSWADFKALPTFTKDEMIEGGLDLLSNRAKIQDLFLSRSSGSSGAIVSVYLDSKMLITQAIQAVRMISEMNPRYGPRGLEMLIYTSEYPYSSIGGFFRTEYVNNLLPSEQMLQRMRDLRPAVVAAYPSILRDLVRIAGGEERRLGLQTVITNSEHSSQRERDRFAEQFACEVYDEFSSEELSSIAYQCREKRYHLTQDSSYVELLSLSSDAEVSQGELGEIVGTCLINEVMPLVRYRQSDLAVLGAEKCPCGRNAPTLETIDGRRNDSFRRADGKVIPAGRILDWTYSLILERCLDVREYRIIQLTLTTVEVQLVVGGSYGTLVDNRVIVSSFKRTFGDDFEVQVVIASHIHRTGSGKIRPIQSLVW